MFSSINISEILTSSQLSIIFRGPLRLKQFSVYLPSGGGAYNRIGEYHAATQTRNGIMFLGNRGGDGSGVVSE